MYKFASTLVLAMAALLGLASTAQAQATPQVKAVFHVNSDVKRVPAILNNIGNHMNAAP